MRDGIRVNGVSPGPTATDQLVNLAGRKAQEQFGDPARSMPYTTPTRKVHDSGAFAAHLSRAGHPGKEAAPTAGFSC
jgi:NAD(P)-dependent dehydrogenase (short-subunit alcohol dehydrogenase family)